MNLRQGIGATITTIVFRQGLRVIVDPAMSSAPGVDVGCTAIVVSANILNKCRLRRGCVPLLFNRRLHRSIRTVIREDCAIGMSAIRMLGRAV